MTFQGLMKVLARLFLITINDYMKIKNYLKVDAIKICHAY